MKRYSNRKNKLRFTQILRELVGVKKMELKNALLLMSKSFSKRQDSVERIISLAAHQIYEALLRGESFSNSLRNCLYIEFDFVYISFTSFAERSGCLEEALDFLDKRNQREEENLEKVIQVSVYPCFVILLAVAAGILISIYYTSVLETFGTDSGKEDLYSSLFFAFLFLLLFCITAFFVLKKTLGINRLYEAFLAMGFLIKGGESIANTVKAAVNILGYETKEGQFFAQAGEKLSYGLSLKDSFALNDRNYSLRSELEEAFFYAENSGGESDVFEKIALWLNTRDEKRRAICVKLIEPAFISGTGIFLFIFLVNLVLPLFSEGTFFL